MRGNPQNASSALDKTQNIYSIKCDGILVTVELFGLEFHLSYSISIITGHFIKCFAQQSSNLFSYPVLCFQLESDQSLGGLPME